MDDIKIFAKNDEELEIRYKNNDNSPSGYKNRIYDRKMCHANNEKREKRIAKTLELPNQQNI